MARQPGTRGFWRGLITGVVLAAAIGLALALAFPPLQPPEITPGSLQPPGAPVLPAALVEPQVPRPEGLLPDPAPAPLIAGVPAPDAVPEPPASPSGRSSLVPPAGR